ncbi:hypothetical protein SAMN05421846_102230 [Chryseobacterium taeanense]|uniref:Uncharacterized protein n=1 Tax=Chryseobacterium taeanense TaxID=311334 RepID=A0A1G8FQ77_9FLAO|nr:hypothetical protein SAMN05421846_102230 [Chryseobacterium taeanense]
MYNYKTILPENVYMWYVKINLTELNLKNVSI